jgi:transcriptional regulator with XRE-family HTH domain
MKTRIGFKLKEIREDRKFSQADMADILALSQSAYSRLERNESSVELDDLVRYAKTLNVPIQDFLPETMHIHYVNQGGQGGPNLIMGDFHYYGGDQEMQKQILQLLSALVGKM